MLQQQILAFKVPSLLVVADSFIHALFKAVTEFPFPDAVTHSEIVGVYIHKCVGNSNIELRCLEYVGQATKNHPEK